MTEYWSFLRHCLKTDPIYKKKLSLLLLSLWHPTLLIDETKSTPWTKGVMVYLMDKLLIRIRAVPRRTHFCTCCIMMFLGILLIYFSIPFLTKTTCLLPLVLSWCSIAHIIMTIIIYFSLSNCWPLNKLFCENPPGIFLHLQHLLHLMTTTEKIIGTTKTKMKYKEFKTLLLRSITSWHL